MLEASWLKASPHGSKVPGDHFTIGMLEHVATLLPLFSAKGLSCTSRRAWWPIRHEPREAAAAVEVSARATSTHAQRMAQVVTAEATLKLKCPSGEMFFGKFGDAE